MVNIPKSAIEAALKDQLSMVKQMESFLPMLEASGALSGFPTSAAQLATEMKKHAKCDAAAIRKSLKELK